MLVTPEREPLAAFGSAVSAEVFELLTAHEIEFVSAHAIRHHAGRLLLAGGRELDVDLAIAIARLGGPRIRGLPADGEGFVQVDDVGRVPGAPHVFAAGDAAAYEVKQGGLATQQADTIAALIAAELDGDRDAVAELAAPVLRAVLFAGRERRYLHAELGERLHETSTASVSPLWPETSKIVGRYLAPYLDRLDRVEPC
jgi:sulfide:quinone oxidoreductase